MKLLVLTTTFPKHKNDYSIPRFVYDLSSSISNLNISTYVLTPDSPNSTQKKEIITENFTINRFKYSLKRIQNLTRGEGIIPSIKKSKFHLFLVPFLLIFQFINAIYLIRKEKVDIINSHWMVPSGLIGAILSILTKRPNFLTIHAAGLYLLQKLPFGNKLARFIYRNSRKIFVVSNFGKKQLYLLLQQSIDIIEYNKKVKVIPMGVYVDKYRKKQITHPLSKKEFNILFLGRIVEKKGLIYAIEALREISDLNIKLHVCGDGPLKQELELKVEEYKLSNKIIFHGRISENKKISYFRTADVLLVPSIETKEGDKEGLPVVILEALAANLPIIATDVGGIKDAVIDGYTGFLIKEKSKEDIKRSIFNIYENKSILLKLKQNIESYAYEFDWKEIAKNYLKEINEK